ncbi:MAG: dephospho-CoA kinase [Lachnospiraceae bacterium]|jgi:dephospho-CoA kinase|nr:dephospho-CoA kinase [Lachnospiraceae bacterium]HBV81858.1 dephospho-CoA kinase [Lachnospiraceae bacterium]
MRIIGITGGVGAGKTKVLSYIEAHFSCRVIRADEAAHKLYEPGQVCYQKLVALLGQEILSADNTIDKTKMAAVIFGDNALLVEVNSIVHPEVKKYILEQIAFERERGVVAYFFIEAALLIEEHYDQIVDEMWYIHSDVAIREKRLVKSRKYSAQKIAEIMKGQLSEEEFRKYCQVIIINNGDLEETYRQINKIMGVEV